MINVTKKDKKMNREDRWWKRRGKTEQKYEYNTVEAKWDSNMPALQTEVIGNIKIETIFKCTSIFSSSIIIIIHWHYTELPNDPSVTIITILITVRGNRHTFTLSLSHTQHGHHTKCFSFSISVSLSFTQAMLYSIRTCYLQVDKKESIKM